MSLNFELSTYAWAGLASPGPGTGDLGEGMAAEGRVVLLEHGPEVAGDVRLGLQVLPIVSVR